MKVGIVLNEREPTDGGGYNFQLSISTALVMAKSNHEFVLLDRMIKSKSINSDGSLVVGIKRKYNNLLIKNKLLLFIKIINNLTKKILNYNFIESEIEKAIRENNIELVWFLSPDVEDVSCPYVMTVWDLQHRLQPWFPEVSKTGWTWQARESHYQRFLPRAAKIITGTNAGKEEIENFYGISSENIKVISLPAPNIIKNILRSNNINEIQKKYDLKKRYFIYPAQFWPHKNHINLLLSYSIAKAKYNEIPQLVLMGSDKGNLNYILMQTKALKLENDVKFLGFISDKDLKHLYEGAVAMVYPSFFGPDNFPPLEAFSLGCPVIAANVSGSEEQLGEAVLRVDPTNTSEIASALILIAQKESLRKDLTNKGFLRSNELKSSIYVEKLIKTIDELEPMFRCWSANYVHT